MFSTALQLITKQPNVEKVSFMDLPVITKANVAQYTCHW